MTSFCVYHFVSSHLSLLKDVKSQLNIPFSTLGAKILRDSQDFTQNEYALPTWPLKIPPMNSHVPKCQAPEKYPES